jgi:beta-barrel assembly-enhancing protease
MRLRTPSPLPAVACLLALAAVVAGLGAGCATSGVNQGDVNLISLQEELQLGQQLERDLSQQLSLNRDSSVNAYVSSLGQRLARQTALGELPWEFHVVNDPAVNAFNIPGGHVYVNTGLIAAADSVAELAGVMSHEIAHGAARHGTEQLTRVYGLNLLAGVLLGENPSAYQQILAQVAGGGAVAHYARGAEREADLLGVRYMYDGGYDPQGMVSIFRELLEQRQRRPSSVEQFFSSHPLTENRIDDTQAAIADLPPKSGLTRTDRDYQSVRSRVTR